MQENNESTTTTVNNSTSGIAQVTQLATSTTSFKVRDGKELQNVFSAIYTLVDEPTIELTPEGLTFRGMDPSHVALIDINLPKDCFEEFNVSQTVRFALPLKELVETLKNVIPKGKGWNVNRELQFIVEDKTLRVQTEKMSASINTLEAYSGSTPLPHLHYKTEFALVYSEDKKDFTNFVTQHEFVKLNSEMTYTEDKYVKMQISSKSDRGEYKENYNNVEGIALDASEASFSGDYLAKILKVLKDDKEIKIGYSTKMPLRIETRPFTYGKLHFYLAPRVQD